MIFFARATRGLRRNGRERPGALLARSGGLSRAILGTTYTSKLGRIILSHSLRPCFGESASLGEEAVLADSGREGEIVAGVERVRSLAFLSILRLV